MEDILDKINVMKDKRLIVAIDTNRINTKNKTASMNQLEEWHKAGYIELVYPGSIVGELREYCPEALNKVSDFNKILGPGKYGSGVTYGNIRYGSTEPEYSKIQKIVFDSKKTLSQNDILDIHHLIACVRNSVDYFITSDSFILSKKDNLYKELGIKVCKSEELVNKLKDKFK